MQSRGTWGKDVAGGVHCVGSGGGAAGGLGAVFGKDAVEERGTDLFWGWLPLDWWWSGWGDGWLVWCMVFARAVWPWWSLRWCSGIGKKSRGMG